MPVKRWFLPGYINRVSIYVLWFLPARRYANATLAVIMCPSVRPSVRQNRCFNKTAKPKITQRTAYDCLGTLACWCQRSQQNSNGVTRNGGSKSRWGKQKLSFSTGRKVSSWNALPPKICVHPPWSSASTTARWWKIGGVINKSGGSQNLMITVTS